MSRKRAKAAGLHSFPKNRPHACRLEQRGSLDRPAASPEEPKKKDAPRMQVNVIPLQERAKVEAKSCLEQLLAEGARKLLQAAIENEVTEYLQGQSNRPTASGERS